MNLSKEIEIVEIPEMPNEILDRVSNGKLVLFIGAGVSRIVGCPSWKELSIRFLDDLLDKKKINFYEYEKLKVLDARKLISICIIIYERSKIILSDIDNWFRGDIEKLKNSSIFQDLISFKAPILTTNYDDLLDNAMLKSFKNEANIIFKKEEMLISKLFQNNTIFHLHGSVKDSKNMILTTKDYLLHYKRDLEPAELLNEIFRKYTVLFVGYGLEEFEIMEFLLTRVKSSANELRHYMLYPFFKNEKEIFNFLQCYYGDLGIQLIPYAIDQNGYNQLEIVIREWAKKISTIQRSENFLEKIKLIDEVLDESK